jgi:hypothetical protein
VEKQKVLNIMGEVVALVIPYANCIFSAPFFTVNYGLLAVPYFFAIIGKKGFLNIKCVF